MRTATEVLPRTWVQAPGLALRLRDRVEDALLQHHAECDRAIVEAPIPEPAIEPIWVGREVLEVAAPVAVPRTQEQIEATVAVVVDEARATHGLQVLIRPDRSILPGSLLIEGREARSTVVLQHESRSLDVLARVLCRIPRANKVEIAVVVDVASNRKVVGPPTANAALSREVDEAPPTPLDRTRQIERPQLCPRSLQLLLTRLIPGSDLPGEPRRPILVHDEDVRVAVAIEVHELDPLRGDPFEPMLLRNLGEPRPSRSGGSLEQ